MGGNAYRRASTFSQEENFSHKSARGNQLAQGMTIHQFHAQEMNPVPLPHRVNGDNVGMVEARRRLGFDAKSMRRFGRVEPFRMDKFHRNDAVETDLSSAKHDSHTPAGDFGQQLVVAERVELDAQGSSGLFENQSEIGCFERLRWQIALQGRSKEARRTNHTP